MVSIMFRPMTEADLPTLFAWLQRPHVARWWDSEDTLEAVREEYAPLLDPGSTTRAFIAMLDREPVGYMQSYVVLGSGDGWWVDETDPGARGIDQFLANEHQLGQGLGTAMVRAFTDQLFADPEVTKVQLDPDPENARAIRCYARAGFAGDRIVTTPNGLARLMVRRRGDPAGPEVQPLEGRRPASVESLGPALPRDRRNAVGFDPRYFARRAAAGEGVAAIDAFRHAYASNHWTGAESRSGPGSGLDQTAIIRREVPALLAHLGVRTLLDLPCGDLHWMSTVELGHVRYIGGDLLPEVIAGNAARHAGDGRAFQVLDLCSSDLPAADLLLCRDCLVHLSFADIARAVANVRRSAVSWVLVTTFPRQATNEDACTGDWRPLNMERAPFYWSSPVRLVEEGCTEGGGAFADKALGLWRVADLPVP